MGFWGEIKQRRITQIVIAYLAAGWMAVTVVDQLVDRSVLPEWTYAGVLTLYLFGIGAALTVGWYHGEKGVQKVPAAEMIILGGLALGGAGTSVSLYRSQAARLDLAAASGLPPTSVAVLYFEDASVRGDLAPVADGITEAIIEQLSEVRSLQVVSTNGVLPFRGDDVRLDSIARALRVGTIIEGSVDQRGEDIRITTRLVDGFTGADIERAVLEIPAGRFLAARDSAAGSVSRLLRQRLGEDVRLREFRASTTSDEAWALAQRAERLRNDAEDNFEGGGETSVSVASYQLADSLLALAESVDPTWARLPGARAQVAYRTGWFAFADGQLDSARASVASGLAHANRALGIDPRDAHALEQRGTLELLDFQLAIALGNNDEVALESQLDRARADLEAAIAEDPALATAHAMLSFLFQGLGDNVGAVLSARRALEEDAYLRGAQRIYDRLAYAQYDLEQFRDSRHWCDEGGRRFPDDYRFAECALWLAATPSATADPAAAWALLAQLDSMVPASLKAYKHGVGTIMVAGVLRRAGMPDSAAVVLATVDHSEVADPQRNLFVYEAGILASTGDADGALDMLRRWAASTPGSALGDGQEAHWWWQSLRARPEFQQFVAGPS